MNLFKKPPTTTTYPLMRGKEVIFNVIMAGKQVEFQSAAKDWTLIFANTSYEYGMAKYLIQENDMDAIHQLAQASFLTRIFFHDAKIIKEFYKEIDRYQKRLAREAASRPQTQSDAEILAEEKVLHEKTAESVKELEDIKNAKVTTKNKTK